MTLDILINLYYSLIYPFLTYALVAWGNTYNTTVNPLAILQKKIIRLITFSNYQDHTNPLFIQLRLLKFHDLIFYHNALFMYDFHTGRLPHVFDEYFALVSQKHNYNIRLASRSSYSLPKVRTNYGKFNIRFVGSNVWNSIDENLKGLSKSQFKNKLKNNILNSY